MFVLDVVYALQNLCSQIPGKLLLILWSLPESLVLHSEILKAIVVDKQISWAPNWNVWKN